MILIPVQKPGQELIQDNHYNLRGNRKLQLPSLGTRDYRNPTGTFAEHDSPRGDFLADENKEQGSKGNEDRSLVRFRNLSIPTQ